MTPEKSSISVSSTTNCSSNEPLDDKGFFKLLCTICCCWFCRTHDEDKYGFWANRQ